MSKSQAHYTADGEQYKGPTHKAGSKLMTGAKHTPKSKVLSHKAKKKK